MKLLSLVFDIRRTGPTATNCGKKKYPPTTSQQPQHHYHHFDAQTIGSSRSLVSLSGGGNLLLFGKQALQTTERKRKCDCFQVAFLFSRRSNNIAQRHGQTVSARSRESPLPFYQHRHTKKNRQHCRRRSGSSCIIITSIVLESAISSPPLSESATVPKNTLLPSLSPRLSLAPPLHRS